MYGMKRNEAIKSKTLTLFEEKFKNKAGNLIINNYGLSEDQFHSLSQSILLLFFKSKRGGKPYSKVLQSKTCWSRYLSKRTYFNIHLRLLKYKVAYLIVEGRYQPESDYLVIRVICLKNQIQFPIYLNEI